MMNIIPAAGREPGIYLHMSSDEYHADPSIGSTGLRKLRIGAPEFWGTYVGNPDRIADEETDAMTFGRAVHALVLEGEKLFKEQFIPDPKDEPDILRTDEEIRKWLKDKKLDVSGLKAEKVKRVKAYAPSVKVYDDIIETAKAEGKRVLSPANWKRIMMAGSHITANPALSRSFTGGMPEISVFWVRNGIKVKARFDYLRAVMMNGKPLAVISDLKSFAAPRDIPIERQVSMVASKHLMQARLYMEGFRAMQAMLREKKRSPVHLSGPAWDVRDDEGQTADWLMQFRDIKEVMFAFVFYKSTGALYSAGRLLTEDNSLMLLANESINRLMETFRQHYETFGVNLPWVNVSDPSHLLEDEIQPWAL